MIDGKNFFDQPMKNNKVTNESIRKIATGQGDDYTTGCLLDYIYFKKFYKRNRKSFVNTILMNKFNSYQYKNDTIQ